MELTMIDRVSGGRPVTHTKRAAKSRASGGFSIDDESRADSASAAGEVAAPAPLGVLAFQEEEQDAAQDRGAKRHGQEVLDELSGLQRDLLGPGVRPDRLRNLVALVDSGPPPADRRLRDVLAAVALRAKIELARYEMARHEIAGPQQKA
jgi:hypothetical protein